MQQNIENSLGRINLVNLPENCFYFESVSASELISSENQNDFSNEKEAAIEGRLHLTTHGLFFVPEKSKFGIKRILYKDVVFTDPSQVKKKTVNNQSNSKLTKNLLKSPLSPQGSKKIEEESSLDEPFVKIPNFSGNVLCIKSECYSLMKKYDKSNPYQVILKPAIHSFQLHHTSKESFLKKIDPIFEIWASEKNHLRIDFKIKKMMEEFRSKFVFDTSNFEDFREKKIFEVDADKIEPLMEIEGKMILTSEKRLYFQSFLSNLSKSHVCIDFSSVIKIIKRRYLLRHIGVEIFTAENTSFYFVFSDVSTRKKFFEIICDEFCFFSDNKKMSEFLKSDENINHEEIKMMTDKWLNHDLTNFDYLLYLNFISDRSFKDLTQYPVFPWVIKDYSSEKLDFSNSEKTFRDLSKPIGALNNKRLQGFLSRYDQSGIKREQRFLYGTHYSSPYFVLYYLVRSVPDYMLRLQNGRFDDADRMFHSVEKCFESVLSNFTDVKELIPEFYHSSGSFLLNSQQLDLGIRNSDGVRIGDVILPKWAKGSPKDFVFLMRQALESDYCSSNLHKWIDLIFGVDQRNIEKFNVFHWLSYEGGLDIDTVTDPLERESYLAQIREFGQCPKRLFSSSHPQRKKIPEKITKVDKFDVTHSDTISFKSIFQFSNQLINNINFQKTNEKKEILKNENSEDENNFVEIKEFKYDDDEENNKEKNIQKENEDNYGNNQNVNENSIKKEKLKNILDEKFKFLKEKMKLKGKYNIHRQQVSSVHFKNKNLKNKGKENFEDLSDEIISSSHDCTIRMFSLKKKKEIRKISSFGALSLSCCCIIDDNSNNSNNNVLAVSSWDNNIYFYNMSYCRLVDTLTCHDDAICSISFNNKISMLISGSWDGQVKLHRISTVNTNNNSSNNNNFIQQNFSNEDDSDDSDDENKRKKKKQNHSTSSSFGVESVMEYDEHNDDIQCVGFSSDGMLAISGDKNGSIVIFDLNTSKAILNKRLHSGAIKCLKFLDNPEKEANYSFVSCGDDKILRRFDLNSGDVFLVESLYRLNTFCLLQISNSFVVVSGNESGVIEFWNVMENTNNPILLTLSTEIDSPITSIDVLENEENFSVVAGHKNGYISHFSTI